MGPIFVRYWAIHHCPLGKRIRPHTHWEVEQNFSLIGPIPNLLGTPPLRPLK